MSKKILEQCAAGIQQWRIRFWRSQDPLASEHERLVWTMQLIKWNSNLMVSITYLLNSTSIIANCSDNYYKTIYLIPLSRLLSKSILFSLLSHVWELSTSKIPTQYLLSYPSFLPRSNSNNRYFYFIYIFISTYILGLYVTFK